MFSRFKGSPSKDFFFYLEKSFLNPFIVFKALYFMLQIPYSLWLELQQYSEINQAHASW